jgi:RND superfamily putative drug exporter
MQTQETSQEHSEAGTAPSAGQHPAALETHRMYRIGLAYGRQVYRLRWLILVLWVVALLVSLPFDSKISSVLKSGGYSFSGSDSVKVSDIAIQKLHQPPSQVLAVFHSNTAPVSDPAYQSEINALASRARALSDVTSVASGGVGKDGRTTYLIINLNKSADAIQQQFSDFRAALTGKPLIGPAQVYLTGDLAVYDEFNQLGQTETEQADGAALPIALVVLLIVFGSLVAAAMPVLLALVAVPIAVAIIYGVALHLDTNVIVLTVASIIGLGLSIDYSLFLVRRFRDELAEGRSVREAVAWTVATSGEAILFSGLTVMVGFLGLLLIGISFMTSFGIGGAVVVSIAVLGALTLLPALLSVLGQRINALRLPWIGRVTQPAHQQVTGGEVRLGFWHRWSLAVMRRPILVIVLVSVLLLGLGWPVLQMEIGIPAASSLPSSSEARQGLDLLHAQFPATNTDPIYVIAQTPDGSSILTPANLARLDHLTRWLTQQQHITSVTSLTQPPTVPGAPAPTTQQLIALYSTGAYRQNPGLSQLVASTTASDTTLITLQSNTKLDSNEANALIDSLRAGDTAAAQGLTVLVGGFQAITLDFDRYLYNRFPETILFILVATFILLLLMFRSLLLPLKAVLMNVLSISVAYGVLVFVFQWGHFENLLGFTSEGFVESTIPVTMFCVLFGLSMDYEVFLLSRIREEWLRTGNNRHAVALGLEKTGSVITNAALLFVIVAGAITFTALVSTKEIGLGMAVAVLVDATIIRSLLVPATMRLLGRWNWWLPGRPLPPRQTDLETTSPN